MSEFWVHIGKIAKYTYNLPSITEQEENKYFLNIQTCYQTTLHIAIQENNNTSLTDFGV